MNHQLIDALTDLIIRMDEAEVRLIDESLIHRPRSDQRKGLEAKANGVVLARSYVRRSLNQARGGL